MATVQYTIRMKPSSGYRLPSWRDFISVLVAGALMPLAFAPFEYFYLVFPLMAVLFYQWRDPSPRNVFLLTWVFSTAMFVGGVYWVYHSMVVFGHIPRPLAGLLTFLFGFLLGLIPALGGWVTKRWFAVVDDWQLLLVIPAMWTLFEWIRSWLFTGFPWLNLGYSQTEQALSIFAPVVGVYGVSWLVALCAASLVVIFTAAIRWKIVSVVVITGVISAALLVPEGEWTKAAGKPIAVTLVQGNIDQDKKWDPQNRELILQQYLDLSRSHWKSSDVIIWPETAIPAYFHQVKGFVEALDRLARESHTDLLTGVVTRNPETREYYNSMVSLGSERRFYSKQHLVPFGEYIPFQKYLSRLLDIMGLPMSGFSTGGKGQAPLPAGGYLAGVTVCYEIAFVRESFDALPAANFLVTVSNNTWFGDSSAPHQVLQMGRMRAIESGRYLLSVTNDGMTAIIDHKGKVVAKAPQFTSYVLTGQVEPRSGATPFVRWGNTPVVIALLVILLIGWVLGKLRPERSGF